MQREILGGRQGFTKWTSFLWVPEAFPPEALFTQNHFNNKARCYFLQCWHFVNGVKGTPDRAVGVAVPDCAVNTHVTDFVVVVVMYTQGKKSSSWWSSWIINFVKLRSSNTPWENIFKHLRCAQELRVLTTQVPCKDSSVVVHYHSLFLLKPL